MISFAESKKNWSVRFGKGVCVIIPRPGRHIFHRFTTAFDLIKEIGWVDFCRKIMPWLLHRKYLFYSGPMEEKFQISQPEFPFRFGLASEDDLVHLVKLRPGFYKLYDLRRRIKSGHYCFLGWSGQKPIHIRWCFTESSYVPYLGRTLLLPSGTIYADEAYTARSFRRKGVYAYAGYLIRGILKDMGYENYVCAFTSWNATYLGKVIESLKMVPIGACDYWAFQPDKISWTGNFYECGEGCVRVSSEKPFLTD